jgi:hypothetical protein
VATLPSYGNAFAPTLSACRVGSLELRAADEASAQALSDYMAKSHEEKLRAIKEVEAKKNTEIEVSPFLFVGEIY